MLRATAALGLLLVSCSAGGAARPQSGAVWDERVALAAAARAEDLAARGDEVRARKSAEQALAAARRAGVRPAEARALAVLGRLDGSAPLVAQAAELARELGDDDAALVAGLALAEQHLEDGDPEAALAVADDLAARLEREAGERDDPAEARPPRAVREARVQHLRCRALRPLGRWEEFDLAARRARLALSLLSVDELPALRFAVDMDVAQGSVAAGRFAEAFSVHVQASLHARAAGDRLGECQALRCMARDLLGLGRERDALAHLERAYDVARLLGDVELARALAKEGLALLHELEEPLDSPRFATFRAALLEG